MKANELRIGQLYFFNGKEYTMNANRLKAIIQTGDYDSISPIPLTEEWLIKFEFELEEEYNIDARTVVYGKPISENCSAEKIRVTLPFNHVEIGEENEARDRYAYVLDMDINYVHQLQNLYFALTNKELKLKTR